MHRYSLIWIKIQLKLFLLLPEANLIYYLKKYTYIYCDTNS